VANAYGDRVSISIHVYGADIGAIRRATFNRLDGRTREFTSGYANDVVPNVWGQRT
jgi:predicted metal-dependent enzyme (double-stranded beta helix superfamily)